MDITAATRLLLTGEIVAIPTETVYGLAADATSATAVAKIYAAKNRPAFNPLIAHVATLEAAQELVVLTSDALKLATSFWPGPLTIVAHKTPDCSVSDLACAGLNTLAVRIPAHPVALDILRAVNRPLAAPSANLSGKLSPTTAVHVHDIFSNTVPVVDGGSCTIGLESTIVSCTGDEPMRILRAGGIGYEDIRNIVPDITHSLCTPTSIQSPGQLTSHYAPDAPLRLNASAPDPQTEVWLGFGPDNNTTYIGENLSRTGSLEEAAARLFVMLHKLDGDKTIAVAPIPETGLGCAINDRLRRAAAPRS